MTLNAYLDNIQEKTGKTAEDFRAMVTHRVRVSAPKQMDAALLAWLKQAYNAAKKPA